jgi:hypothetical protein
MNKTIKFSVLYEFIRIKLQFILKLKGSNLSYLSDSYSDYTLSEFQLKNDIIYADLEDSSGDYSHTVEFELSLFEMTYLELTLLFIARYEEWKDNISD